MDTLLQDVRYGIRTRLRQPGFAATAILTNATAKVYRLEGDSTGRVTYSSNSAPNSITAMGANQITVGTALNANGVTYDVWTITTGTVTPW